MNRKGFLSQEAALVAETEARRAYARADLAADGSVAAELENWLRECELDLQPATLSNYRDVIGYIKPHLGSRHAYTLDKRAIHDLYLTLLKRGSRRGGPLARETVRTRHRVLMKALKDMGITIEDLREPGPEDKETQGRKGVWTPKQAVQFLRHHAEDRLIAAWTLSILTGLRRGELAGLKWACVDLERGALRVHWQRTTTRDGVVEKEPKGKGKRTVALGPMLVTALRAHRTRQDAEKAAADDLYDDAGYVSAGRTADPTTPGTSPTSGSVAAAWQVYR